MHLKWWCNRRYYLWFWEISTLIQQCCASWQGWSCACFSNSKKTNLSHSIALLYWTTESRILQYFICHHLSALTKHVAEQTSIGVTDMIFMDLCISLQCMLFFKYWFLPTRFACHCWMVPLNFYCIIKKVNCHTEWHNVSDVLISPIMRNCPPCAQDVVLK